jgi:hypothetical protein
MDRIGVADLDLEMAEGELTAVRHRLEVSGHDFCGSLTHVELRSSGARIEFRYEYEPFKDAKYPDEGRYAGFEPGAPTWVRIYFAVRCSRCADESEHSTQTNIGRPYNGVCHCGWILYRDVEPPKLTWSLLS